MSLGPADVVDCWKMLSRGDGVKQPVEGLELLFVVMAKVLVVF